MSGPEHRDIGSAQFDVTDEDRVDAVDCSNSRVKLSDGNNGVQESVQNWFSESSELKTSVFSSNVMGGEPVGYDGGVMNWDMGPCANQGLNSMQAVEEVFDVFGMGFTSNESPGMDSGVVKSDAAQNPDIEVGTGINLEEPPPVAVIESVAAQNPYMDLGVGIYVEEQLPVGGSESNSAQNPDIEVGAGFNVEEQLPVAGGGENDAAQNPCIDAVVGINVEEQLPEGGGESNAAQIPCTDVGTGINEEEQLPVGGGESVTCEPEVDGMMCMDFIDEKVPGSSVGEMGAMGEVPCLDAREDCSGAGNNIIEETTEETLSLRMCENKMLEPVEFTSWASICEVAKESEESARFALTEEDLHKLFHDSSEVDDQAQPQDFTGVFPSVVTATNSMVSEKMIDKSEQKEKPVSENHEVGSFLSLHIDESEQKEKPVSGVDVAGTKTEQNALRSVAKLAEKLHRDVMDRPNQQSGLLLGNIDGMSRVTVLGLPAKDGTEKPSYFRTPTKKNSEKLRSGRRPGKASASAKKRTSQKPSAPSARILRSRSHDDPIAAKPSTDPEQTKGSSAGRRGRKKKEMKEKSQDEFSKMKTHLRYLLNRIRYEQNLLDAYSSEGWRGQSLEKLRPEKELQRAKADINRSKLKIRALFQRLDTMSAEGKFPDSVYDSDGLIDSEDIFCAKCGSKDLPTGNDIILCDGICERGFHQYCLVPPLRTEEIPPGDEGWLCPTCDCRVDCIDLLNDSQSGKLSIEDSWEKVFPEAAAAGREKDDLMGLPSDDSEDYDYNPEGRDDDAKVEGEEANSGESDSSDFSSVPEDLGDLRGDEQYLGFPSDDSEDNDFDPDAPNVNDDDGAESSSSDFTSASEDLGATVGNDSMSDIDEPSESVDLDQDVGDSQLLSGRRNVERLDYKKLYVEEYGNTDSDSSDDEEWTENVATKRKKKVAEKNVLASANGDVPVSPDSTYLAATPRTRGRANLNDQGVGSPSGELQKTPLETSSGSKSKKRPPLNRLGESVTQRLLESFKENQYPDRATKELLAKELGLTPARVDKWFGNARWSHRHHPSRMEASIARVLPHSSAPQTFDGNGAERASALHSGDTSKMDTKGSVGENNKQSRKRKEKTDDEPVGITPEMETPNESTPVSVRLKNNGASPLSTPETQHGSMKRRTRSSGLL